MRRILPFISIASKTLLSKTLAQNTSITISSFRILQTLNPKNYSSNKRKDDKGRNPNSKPSDPGDQAWQEKQKKIIGPKSRWDDEESDEEESSDEEEESDEGDVIRLPVSEIDNPVSNLPSDLRTENWGLAEESAAAWATIRRQYLIDKTSMQDDDDTLDETSILLDQVMEPGLRGAYLKDSEKAEMYKLHKENPEVYTVERLAKDFRVMRQRVHAILWLKEDEEEMEKRLGPLDDMVEQFLDACPEFLSAADREFHVAQLPDNPDFKVMPEDWDGTAKDPDEMLWEISQKEDEMLYQEFVERMNYNKAKIAGKIKCHQQSRRRPSEGWKFTVEELGAKGKRGRGGGRKFVSLPNGSRRPLDELEKMFLRRETNRTRRKL